jgi:hypothetical protein
LRGSVSRCRFLLERTMKLVEIEGGWRLELDLRARNTSQISHCHGPGRRIRCLLPRRATGSCSRIRLRRCAWKAQAAARLGKGGDSVSWPLAQLASGGKTDLSVVQGADSGIGDKLFAGPLQAATENWCALERPGAGLRIKVGFDPAENPYLGLWICYGGWPERPGQSRTEADVCGPGAGHRAGRLAGRDRAVVAHAGAGRERDSWTMTVGD